MADFELGGPARRTLGALARVVCPGDIAELGLGDAILAHAELTMRSLPAPLRLGVVLACLLFELGTLVFLSSRLRTFSRLDARRQAVYFGRWFSSRFGFVRQIAKALKALVALAYWEQPAVLARMAYHPEHWIAEVAKRRLERYGGEIRAGEALVLEPDPLVPPERLRRGPAGG